jgi:hypothetical protein
MSVYPPFFKERHRMTVDGIKPQHAIRGPYLRKLRTKITLPEILIIDNVWRGASEIVKIFRLTYTNGLSLLNIVPSSNANYCACVAWRVGTEVFRYKLWKNIGEILYAEDYTGQCVGTEFDIEIWNTNNAILHGGGDIIYLSQLTLPTSYCDSSDNIIELNLNLHSCVDVIFDLNDFVPAEGDYYTIVELDGCRIAELIKPPIYPYLTLQANDNTWHNFYLVRQPDGFGGTFTTYFIDPTNVAPSGLGYIPFRFLGYSTGFKLKALLIAPGAYDIDTNESVTDISIAVVNILIIADNGLKYTVNLGQFASVTDAGSLEIGQVGL